LWERYQKRSSEGPLSCRQPHCERNQRSRNIPCSLIRYSSVPRPRERLSGAQPAIFSWIGHTRFQDSDKEMLLFDESRRSQCGDFIKTGRENGDRTVPNVSWIHNEGQIRRIRK